VGQLYLHRGKFFEVLGQKCKAPRELQKSISSTTGKEKERRPKTLKIPKRKRNRNENWSLSPFGHLRVHVPVLYI
jgi:hypothetical protein